MRGDVQCAGEGLEERLGLVVIVAPIEHRRVQVHPRLKRDGLKHMSDQSGGHPPNGGIAEIGLDHGVGPPAEVDHYPRQRFVHGHVGRAHTRDAVAVAQGLVEVLKKCGDDLTRENVMKQAASLQNAKFEMLIPGILVNTSATDFAPIQQEQLQKFEGDRWVLFGEIYDASKKATN